MGECQGCAHWDQELSLHPLGWGTCKLGDGSGTGSHRITRAFATGGEQRCAYLVTAPDFGCVQFCARELAAPDWQALAIEAERQLRRVFATLCYADKLSSADRSDTARDCFILASRIQAARDADSESH